MGGGPVCVKPWEHGDNGGATPLGVTAESITIKDQTRKFGIVYIPNLIDIDGFEAEFAKYKGKLATDVPYGVHTAGPNLTPKTFQKGLFATPATGGAATDNPANSMAGHGGNPLLPYDEDMNHGGSAGGFRPAGIRRRGRHGHRAVTVAA